MESNDVTSVEFAIDNGSSNLFEAKDTGITKNPLILSDRELAKVDAKFEGLALSERRGNRRLACTGSLVFYTPSGRILVKGTIKDFSIGGINVETVPTSLELSATYTVDFSVLTLLSMTHIRCTVKRIAHIESDDYQFHKIGIEFCDLTPIQKKKINEFIASLNHRGFTDTDR
jgi:hypothetical protein